MDRMTDWPRNVKVRFSGPARPRRPERNHWFPRVIFWLFIAAAAYITIAHLTFQIRHPELTDTERGFRVWDWICWR